MVLITMEQILDNAKSFEYLRDRFDPAYDDMVRAIEIVKKFIIRYRLIIYGGSAIDFALRLKGDKIYPDDSLAVPDLDFYSPESVEHAYELADILYNAGFKVTRVVRAMYVRTMHVDLIDGHFIADITYCPDEVFKNLPTLSYNGMRIIHPDFQRIDMHSSLCFPYDNPPREVIFDRWNKDIKRFNLMHKYYPVYSGIGLPVREIKMSSDYNTYTLSGFAAYGLLYAYWLDYLTRMDVKPPKLDAQTPPARFNDNLYFHTYDSTIDIMHFDIERAASELELQNAELREAYFGAVYETVYAARDGLNVRLHSTRGRLLSVNIIKFGGVNYKVINVQGLLRYFIAYANISAAKLRNMYMSHYISLLEMIDFLEKNIKNPDPETLKDCPFFPSVYTYGRDNESLAYRASLNMLLVDIGEAEALELPWNYYPERSIPEDRPHPVFNYDSSEFYRESGRVIKRDLDYRAREHFGGGIRDSIYGDHPQKYF